MATTASAAPPAEDNGAELVRVLAALGVRVAVFDMDQTMVALHSRGRLRRTEVASFASRVTPDFVTAARALAALALPSFFVFLMVGLALKQLPPSLSPVLVKPASVAR